MKKKTSNYLRNTANNLPTVYEMHSVGMSGEELIEKGITVINDIKVKPKKWYTGVKFKKPVNHENRLKALWQNTPESRREQAVQAYVDAAFALHESQKNEAIEKIEAEIQSV